MLRVLITFAVLAMLALPATARADQPIVTTQHVEYAITIPADQNPCGFDLVFTALGDVTATTFSDGQQTSHGILQHTIASPWHTLSSIVLPQCIPISSPASRLTLGLTVTRQSRWAHCTRNAHGFIVPTSHHLRLGLTR